MALKHEANSYGILAEYDSAPSIYAACKKVRNAGYSNWDACTPFAVHGLDKAMGLKSSKLPWAVLCAGLSGVTLAAVFMVWASAYDYPLNIGGKPTWSIPAFIPIMFEVTVLFSALTAAFGMFAINRLPRLHHPLFNCARFSRVTDDRFFIVIECCDPRYDAHETRRLLEESGAVAVENVEDKNA